MNLNLKNEILQIPNKENFDVEISADKSGNVFKNPILFNK